ncbi:protein-L-isoaspartate O-methyltransferase [Rhodoferax sp. GW822-FHT02A01]|uniref:protein-L-isoaspartate O-methyltransferase family protein n=1 Tax=Rhodoferax sp. GW822-FHT02A01 TaxID=3141537 RepID=UPI00315C8A70
MPAFDIQTARFNMIEQQIRPWNVLDSGVLDLLASVRRDEFVPPEHKALAYADLEIPLPGGQYMLTPRVEARLLQDAAVQKTDSVLEIGTGSGFLTALLARRAARVLSLELSPELVAFAKSNLQKAGITNVDVRQGDGSQGAAAQGPFDVIVLGGSVADVPHKLLDQLKIGGRLAAIVGDDPIMRATIITRTSATDFRTSQPWDCDAPRLQNFAQVSRFTF